jgi:hypothetical protein
MSNASRHAQSKDPYKPIAPEGASGNSPRALGDTLPSQTKNAARKGRA